MTDLKDALLRAKLITEDQLKKSQEEEKLKAAAKEKSRETRADIPSQRLTDEQFKKFEDLWNNEKSKPFAIHLLHSFLPFPDNDTVWDWNEKPKWKNGKKCCICELETLSKQDVFEHLDEFSKLSLDSMFKEIKEENFNKGEFLSQGKKKIFGDRLLGVTSERTQCVMCMPCYEIFGNWVPTKLVRDQFSEFAKIMTYVRRTRENRSQNEHDYLEKLSEEVLQGGQASSL